jgi:hypothetical protein
MAIDMVNEPLLAGDRCWQEMGVGRRRGSPSSSTASPRDDSSRTCCTIRADPVPLSGTPRARIGATTWRTSIFADTKRATYVLPVTKLVRAAEGLADGEACSVELTVVAGE